MNVLDRYTFMPTGLDGVPNIRVPKVWQLLLLRVQGKGQNESALFDRSHAAVVC